MELLTVKEISEATKLSKSLVYRLLATGQIANIRVTNGRRTCLRVRSTALEQWLKARETVGEGAQ